MRINKFAEFSARIFLKLMLFSSFPQVSSINIALVMMLNTSFHENSGNSEILKDFDSSTSSNSKSEIKGKLHDIRIILDKIRAPKFKNVFCRSRLNDLVAKQVEQFGSTLVLGRAGTGKTTVATEFAKKYEHVSWFRVESTDIEWETFSQYFLTSFQDYLPGIDPANFESEAGEEIETTVLRYLETLFSELEKVSEQNNILIVLDDLHSVFDVDWFSTFFHGLLSFENPKIHILMMSRSKPPFPLWRLRSKQKLGVLDESLLLFTTGELEQFVKDAKVPKSIQRTVYRTSYGRISKILELLGTDL